MSVSSAAISAISTAATSSLTSSHNTTAVYQLISLLVFIYHQFTATYPNVARLSIFRGINACLTVNSVPDLLGS